MAQYDIATLYRRHAERLTRYVRQRVGSAEEAEDIVQNVFLELCKPGVLNRADKDIDAYVFGAARHLTSQHLKKARAQETALTKFLSASEPLSPCTESDRGESEVGRIQTLLMQLPPKAHNALRSRVLDGLSSRNAAKKVGCSEHALQTRLYRAIRGLRDLVLHDRSPKQQAALTPEASKKQKKQHIL